MKNGIRYRALDGVRGAAVISMILYHAMWDAVNLLGFYVPWFYSRAGYIWQQSICWTFILLSGFCFRLGMRKLRRALIVSAAGAAVTIVTALFMPDNIIIFGILTLLGACMLITVPFDKVFTRINPWLGLLLTAAVFFVTRNVNDGTLGFENIILTWLPHDALYKNSITAFFGFPPYAFRSSDYFSFIPWFFLFIAGYFLYGIFETKNRIRIFKNGGIRPLEFIGRHALVIYLAHQPILYAVTEFINYFKG